jgi:hypothetical protein
MLIHSQETRRSKALSFRLSNELRFLRRVTLRTLDSFADSQLRKKPPLVKRLLHQTFLYCLRNEDASVSENLMRSSASRIAPLTSSDVN